MLNPDVAVPLVILIVASSAMVHRWLSHRERMAQMTAAKNPVDSERLERLEQAVESIALETERIGEGQRYLTRLLAERAERESERVDRPFRQGGVNTPH